VLLFIHFTTYASHIVGGEIYYDYLGNNQYRVNIALYRDCMSTGAAYDDPLSLGIFDENNNLYMSVSVPFPGSVSLPVVFNNPCVTPPTGICTERAIYTTVVTLPPSAGGYNLTYQRCCRGPNVTNLVTPEDTGLTLTTHIPGSAGNAYINSSPRFVNYPPLVICNNENLNFDHHATDPDGDLLEYQLVTPFAGANSFNPQPVPPPAPNYPFVNWESSFSATVPLGAGSTTTINNNSGQLFVDANALGLYVVGIRVNEYRNGVLISSTTRDFLFRVVNCVVQMQANVASQEQTPGFVSYCQGLSFTFDNQSFGGSSYAWDFGVSGITTDVSTAYEPTYVFPAPGIYNVTLVVNPGWPCTDTAHVQLNLNNPLTVDFTYPDSLCLDDNSVDFVSQVMGDPGVSLSWDFGPNANPATATTANVNGVHFVTSGNHQVTLSGSLGVCSDNAQHSIYIVPEPVANFSLPVNYECLGLTQSFTNTSTGATTYHWDFGDPNSTTDLSTATNPTFTFPAAGTYTITLIAEVAQGCSDTLQQDFTVYEPLSVNFTHNDSLCITNNSFNFAGDVSGPSITTYSWDFGPNANPSSATSINVSNVVYNQPGEFPVTLTASFLNCSETATSSVFVFKEPTIGFGLEFGTQCVPYPAYFTDSSSADTPIDYFWDFGDGGTSTEQNPTHIYTQPGSFVITLQITTTSGCATTLSLTRADLIDVHPTPVSGFSVDPQLTDICHAGITFTDHSQNSLFFYYIFDDEGAVSQEQSPVYWYTTPGTHHPMQIVINEFECRDTTYQDVFIEPFALYIPNTFTPDGDEFNNYFKAVSALQAEEWEMNIYNRWGQLVFSSSTGGRGWDGRINGQLQKTNTYVWMVKAVDYNGKAYFSKGMVTLVR